MLQGIADGLRIVIIISILQVGAIRTHGIWQMFMTLLSCVQLTVIIICIRLMHLTVMHISLVVDILCAVGHRILLIGLSLGQR